MALSVMQSVDHFAWKQHWISYRFAGLEKMLHPLQGQYSHGDTVTMADCCLVPQVATLCIACEMTMCALTLTADDCTCLLPSSMFCRC